MTNIARVDGLEVKRAFVKSTHTPEKAVALIQDELSKLNEGISFSLSGLTKLFRGEPPKKDSEKILIAVAKVFNCSLSDFAEFEAVAS